MEQVNWSEKDDFEIISPSRGTEQSAGVDICIPSKFTDAFKQAFQEKNSDAFITEYMDYDAASLRTEGSTGPEEFIVLPAFKSVVIPTGLRFEIPEQTFLEVTNRSSIAAKHRLICGAKIIDADYQGYVFVNLINTNNQPIYIYPGVKIAQLIHKDYRKDTWCKKPDNEIHTSTSERGFGALGSTGA